MHLLEDGKVELEQAREMLDLIDELEIADMDSRRGQEILGTFDALMPWIESMEVWESYNSVGESKEFFRDGEDGEVRTENGERRSRRQGCLRTRAVGQ